MPKYTQVGHINNPSGRWFDWHIGMEYIGRREEVTRRLGYSHWLDGDLVVADEDGDYLVAPVGWDDDEYEEEGEPTQFPEQASDEWVVYRVTPGDRVAERKKVFKGLPEVVAEEIARYISKIPMQFLGEWWVRRPDGTFASAQVIDIWEEWYDGRRV